MCKGKAVRQSRKMVNEDHIAIKLVVLWGNPFHHTTAVPLHASIRLITHYLLKLSLLSSGFSSSLFVGLSLLEKSFRDEDLLSGGNSTVVGKREHTR